MKILNRACWVGCSFWLIAIGTTMTTFVVVPTAVLSLLCFIQGIA